VPEAGGGDHPLRARFAKDLHDARRVAFEIELADRQRFASAQLSPAPTSTASGGSSG
jgi:hypothetical protein